ncbi:UNKNOWN [Stylonychia lemnae]|uniref:Uncharacterized protein n=1 Tax=Stylonychia lemnae TaxID=5949 RepID=A0A078B089_STYLE|nr:UNKNOWN [Stylonychia lemnae]|eukprot:CDW87736.1 UNKNOWN [Stylonychia lemnae]
MEEIDQKAYENVVRFITREPMRMTTATPGSKSDSKSKYKTLNSFYTNNNNNKTAFDNSVEQQEINNQSFQLQRFSNKKKWIESSQKNKQILRQQIENSGNPKSRNELTNSIILNAQKFKSMRPMTSDNTNRRNNISSRNPFAIGSSTAFKKNMNTKIIVGGGLGDQTAQSTSLSSNPFKLTSKEQKSYSKFPQSNVSTNFTRAQTAQKSQRLQNLSTQNNLSVSLNQQHQLNISIDRTNNQSNDRVNPQQMYYGDILITPDAGIIVDRQEIIGILQKKAITNQIRSKSISQNSQSHAATTPLNMKRKAKQQIQKFENVQEYADKNQQDNFESYERIAEARQKLRLDSRITAVNTQSPYKYLTITQVKDVEKRLLNTYVHNYKDKLCLTNEETTQNKGLRNSVSKKRKDEDFSLAVDFNELKQLKQATEEAGFDPYTQYLKIKRDLKHQQRCNIQPLIDNGRNQSPDQYDPDELMHQSNKFKIDDSENLINNEAIAKKLRNIDEEQQIKRLLTQNQEDIQKHNHKQRRQIKNKRVFEKESLENLQKVFYEQNHRTQSVSQNGNHLRKTSQNKSENQFNQTFDNLKDIWVNLRNYKSTSKQIENKYRKKINSCKRNFNKMDCQANEASRQIKKEQEMIQIEKEQLEAKQMFEQMQRLDNERKQDKYKRLKSVW